MVFSIFKQISSFNCKNLQTSHGELYSFCEEHDIVCLQETWLAKNELSLLSNINDDFIGNEIPSIDDESQINVGIILLVVLASCGENN